MVRIIQNYYIDPEPRRQEEIENCLYMNMVSGADEIILFTSESPEGDKIVKVDFDGRPTFKDYFDYINTVAKEDDISIICNSDIFFLPKDIGVIHSKIKEDEVYVLSRWDVTERGDVLFDRDDSQDTWIFKGLVGYVEDCDITLGKAGIDNAIAERLQRKGYTVLNPSRTIKSFHLHKTMIRRYNPVDAISRPYLLVKPHYINEKPQYRWIG